MALQDLTPQLRTRMTRVERLVGLFVLFAALLMAAAFLQYLLSTGKRRGWFVNKVLYYCYTRDASGLKAGDPVRLLGRNVGRIVEIEANPPDQWFVDNQYNIFVQFEIWDPYFGYIWTDSRVQVLSSDFFGSRYLEVTRGKDDLAAATVVLNPRRFADSLVISDKHPKNGNPTNLVKLRDARKGIWLPDVDEAPTLAQRAESIVRTVDVALPQWSRQIDDVLTQVHATTSNANLALQDVRPTLGHVQNLAARLESEQGAVGRLLLTTNLESRVDQALLSMDATLTNTASLIRTSETQLADLTRRLALTLDNVALVTSNLSAQVGANSYVLGEISSLVVHADDLLQGLKRHWLLRSSFPPATNPPLQSVVTPSLDVLPPGR